MATVGNTLATVGTRWHTFIETNGRDRMDNIHHPPSHTLAHVGTRWHTFIETNGRDRTNNHTPPTQPPTKTRQRTPASTHCQDYSPTTNVSSCPNTNVGPWHCRARGPSHGPPNHWGWVHCPQSNRRVPCFRERIECKTTSPPTAETTLPTHPTRPSAASRQWVERAEEGGAARPKK